MLRDLLHHRILGYLAAVLGIAAATAVCLALAGDLNSTTVALAMLMVVLCVAEMWGGRPALLASMLGGASYDYYFLSPLNSLAIASGQQWVALAAFVVAALTVGALSARANRRTSEADRGRRDARLESDYHRGLIEANLDPLVIIGRDGKVSDLNAATEAITGRYRAEILGTDFAEYFTDPAQARAGYERALREGKVRNYPLQIRGLDNAIIPVLCNASVYRDGQGGVAGVLAAARDISALVAAEREIRRLASFPQLAPIPIIEFDRALRILFMNPAMQEVLGQLGQTLAQAKHAGPPGEDQIGDPRAFVPARWAWELSREDGVANDLPGHQEIDINGRSFDERISFSQEFQSLRIWATDITERKQAERALKQMNRTLKTLSRASQILVRATSESELLEEMCRVLIDVGGYRMVWIGLAEHDEARTVRTAAVAGHEDGYLQQAQISWADTERGRGPTGTAIRTGEPQVNRSFATDPRMAPWRDQALQRGYASSVALPLRGKTGAFGALTIYAGETDAFGPDDLQLFTELADDLAYGIAAIRAGAEQEARVR